MPPKVISGGDNPYDIHDAKLSSSATAHESSSVTAHEISNKMVGISLFYWTKICIIIIIKSRVEFEKCCFQRVSV